METKSQIFRAYDIRGIYGKDIDENLAEKIGKSIGTFFGKGKRVAVGRDVRLSGESLNKSLINGIKSTGCNVVDVGIVPSPVLYFAPIKLEADGGVMITASHLPPEWNGFKICDKGGIVLSDGTGLEKIKNIFLSGKFNSGNGNLEKTDVTKHYIDFVSSKSRLKRKLKIVLDLANSVASLVAPNILRNLGADVITIHEELDGRFPNRVSEPTEESLQKLKKKVIETKADMGIGYDGDADRMSIVDEKGRVFYSGNILIPIFAKHYLSQKKGKIVMDLTCSLAAQDFIKKNGGDTVVIRVGHSYCSHTTKKENALFGGQYSGHMCFPETFFTDDAVFASIKMAEIVSNYNGKLSEIVDSIPTYPASKISEIPCNDDRKFQIVDKIADRIKNDGYRILDIDGVKAFDENNDWFLIRASNTMPIIKVNSEAKTESRMTELFDYANNLVKSEVSQ